jgi:outer membrane protein, multidrug efflux system
MRSSLPMRSARVLLAALALGVVAPARVAQTQTVPAPPVAFWVELGDTTLVRLITGALDANPDMHAAHARVRSARAARAGAAFDLGPSVTAVGGYSRQRLSTATLPGAIGQQPDQHLWDAGVQVSWELDVFGRGRRTLQSRNALLASAVEDVRDVQVLLAAEIAHAWFDLNGVQDRLDVAVRNAENQRRTLEVTLDRLEAGRGTALDTERAQAQLSATLAAIPALEAARTAAQHRISVLTGRQPSALVPDPGADASLPTLPDIAAATDAAAQVRERPDVRSAERRLAAHTAAVSAARAEYLPRLSIGARAGYTASAFESLGNAHTPRYVVGPMISWPLLDLGRVKSSVDVSRAGRAEAAAHYEQAMLRAIEEVETSIVAYNRTRERLQHLEDAAAASERATELARLRFDEGGTGFLEVLDAERTQLEAQDRLALGRREVTAGLVAVYQALGGRR